MAALGAVVAFFTWNALRQPAITMEDEVFCGMEEHQHSAESGCYEKLLICTEPEGHLHTEDCYVQSSQLICPLEEQEAHEHTEACYDEDGTLICLLSEEGHIHSGNCYETESTLVCELPEGGHIHGEECYVNGEALICEKPEHIHSLQCYSDPDADLETAEVWERSVSCAELSGNRGEDAISIAMTQLGYTESGSNYMVSESGEICGYTRYGAWYGSPCARWDAMFCAFCYSYAGVPDEVMPYAENAQSWMGMLDELGLFRTGDYLPHAGDLVFFDLDGDTLADHVALAAELQYNEDGSAVSFTVIEGDIGGTVGYNTVFFGDERLLGFGELRESAENGSFTLEAETENGYHVSVSGSTDALPYPLEELRLFVLLVENEEANTLMTEAAEQNTELSEEESSCEIENLLFDITILHSDPETGEESIVEPIAPVTLSITGVSPPGELQELYVYHVDTEAGTAETIEANVTEEGGIAVETDHFSIYGVQIVTNLSGYTAISSASDLSKLSEGKNCYLNKDISTGNTIKIAKTAKLNLNGHKITFTSNPLFEVTGGTFTIEDSKAAPDGTAVSGSLCANTASYSSGTLTYYITDPVIASDPSDAANGATKETLYKFSVSGVGMIVGSGSGNRRAISMSGGTVNLNSGYICNCKAGDDGGAVYQNGGTLNLNGTVLAANTASNRGGAIAAISGTLNFNDGAISGNTASGNGGGGIYVEGATVNMSGGYLTNNLSTSTDYWHGGGGILVGRGSSTGVFNLRGGYVTGNRGAGGGGIRTVADWGNNSGKIYMSGGFVSANNSAVAEGGGISISPGGFMQIVADSGKKCYITDNIAGGGVNDGGFDDWGGGGLFCSENSCTVYIEDALITDNAAGGFGGGVAGCSTGRITMSDDHGAAIFGNDAVGENCSGSESTKNEDHFYAAENEVFMSHGYQDYFCALSSTISGGMLGGGAELWEGSSDGYPVSSTSADEDILGGSVTGLTSLSEEGDRELARAAAKVFFNGNESPTHGGGILANGYLLLGKTDKVETYARLELQAQKKLLDESGKTASQKDKEFLFAVSDEVGNIVSLGKNDESGTISFDRRLPFSAAGSYTYYIYELPGDIPGIQQDTSRYKLEVTVGTKTDAKVPWMNIPITQYVFTKLKATEVTSNQVIFENSSPNNDETHAVTLKPMGDKVFVNRTLPESPPGGGGSEENPFTYSVSVKKAWKDTKSPLSSVTVTLYDGANIAEVAAGDSATVVLNAKNSWKHTWSGLDPTHNYTVKEADAAGFKADYSFVYNTTVGEISTGIYNGVKAYVKTGDYYIPATGLKSGSSYVFASEDGKVLLMTSQEHEDSPFTSADKTEVTKHTGSITISGTKYSNTEWFEAAGIPDEAVYTVGTYTNNEGNQNYSQTVLKRKAAPDSWLLVEQAGDNFLKGGNNINYCSCFRISNGYLQGQEKWYKTGAWRYVIYDGSHFTTDTKRTEIKLETVISSEKAFTVTNTPAGNVEYALTVRKVDAEKTDTVLSGAEFELRLNGTAQLFSYDKVSGKYTYTKTQQTGVSTKLVTSGKGFIQIVGLPGGSYQLVETAAPFGYTKAEPVDIVLGTSTEGTLVTVTVEDEAVEYVLPETGGIGILGYYLAGSLLTAFSLLSFLRLYRRRDKE